MENRSMKRTRLSLFYLSGYLFPTGLALLWAGIFYLSERTTPAVLQDQA
jgi:hypothetical protein